MQDSVVSTHECFSNSSVAAVEERSQSEIHFWPLAGKTVAAHTLTYLLMGALAFHFLHYADFINKPGSGLRPITDPWVMLGAPLQFVRGLLFASVFYPLRSRLFGAKHGWLRMSWILAGIGILGTFAAPAGSLEGFIYTTIPLQEQVRGYLEIVPQALLCSALLCYWVKHPGKRWLNRMLILFYGIAVVLPLLAFVTRR